MARTILSWNEPTFFKLQFRTKQQWLVRLAVALAIGAVFMLLLSLRPGQGWPSKVLIGLLVGAFITALPDFLLMMREVWISEEAFHCDASAGTYGVHMTFPLAGIQKVELIRAETWKRKNAGVQLHLLDGGTQLFGVPKARKLETIATLLHRLGVAVELEGWEPTTADTRIKVDDEMSLANLQATTRDAVFLPIPAEEPKLNPTASVVTGGAISLSPLVLWLVGAIWTGVHLWQNWAGLSWIGRSLAIGGIVAGFFVAFMILFLALQFSDAAYRIGVARQSLRGRINPLMDADEDDVIPISLYNREMWAAVMSHSADFGFLQVSRRKKAILFEGEKERWSIPLTALTAVRTEVAEVGKEGTNPSEIRYFVVIGTHRDGHTWEIGLKSPRTTWGYDGAEARKKRASLLFDELRSAVSLV